MPLWQWIADTAGVALLLVLCYAIALVVRRRYISRNGGTFELSHRARSAPTGRGWVLGLGRYSGDDLEWFRIFSLSPRPRRTWSRAGLAYLGRRDPEGHEQMSLYADHVIVTLQHRARRHRPGDEPVVPDGLPGLARGGPARLARRGAVSA